jgi:hypothetical protein
VAFKVAARTILELGAELISSDAVAIYELVKTLSTLDQRMELQLNFLSRFATAIILTLLTTRSHLVAGLMLGWCNGTASKIYTLVRPKEGRLETSKRCIKSSR